MIAIDDPVSRGLAVWVELLKRARWRRLPYATESSESSVNHSDERRSRCLDWTAQTNPMVYDVPCVTEFPQIVVSQSDGRLAIWRLNPAGGAPVQAVGPWHAHSLRGGVPTEAWISFFRRGSEGEDGSFVVSGADDGLMKGWDERAGGAGPVTPAFVCKEHGAGVTAGQWHPTRQYTFARYVVATVQSTGGPCPIGRASCMVKSINLPMAQPTYSSGYDLWEMFKRKHRFKRVKLAWHHQNRLKRKLVLFLRFSLKSNFWKSHVAITHQHAHTQLQTPCPAQRAGAALSQMTRQARQGSQITNGEECGHYLHGNCGVVDPRGTREMNRICHTCATSRESETSGAGTAGAQS